MNDIITENDPNECLKQVNKLRLKSPDKWLFVEIHCNDQVTLCKSFNTSIQVLKKNGISYPDGFDLSVGKWKECILNAINA